MSDATILSRLGSEYRTEVRPRAWWAVLDSERAALERTGFGPESDGGLRASDLFGRKPLFELEDGGARYVVRRFSHGGLWRFATGRRFRDPTRPFHEILCARHLEAHGVRTPRIVAARARRAHGPFWELDLVTERIGGTLDLGELLGRARRGEVPPRVVAHASAALGLLVRRLHASGFFHADLTPNNVLVNASLLEGLDPELWILDLDRARILGAWNDADRRANLRRLLRFVARREERDGRALRRTDYARFLLAYDLQGEEWKDEWRAVARDHARSLAGHRLGWRLEEWLGKRRDVRERTR